MLFWRVKPLDKILETAGKKALTRQLGAFQLTMLGIGAVIGTGIFVLTAEAGQKAAEMIVLNAGAALYAADLAYTLKEGVALAHDALHTGLAREKLEELGAFTAIFKQENEA